MARGNGLQAASYVAVVDLDPRLADEVLDLLRGAGVAAYVTPAAGRRGPYLDVQLPARPTDRLYVDAERAADARATLAHRLPELEQALEQARSTAGPSPAPVDEEAAWAAIVAGFDTVPADPVPRWPVSEDLAERPGPGPVAGPAGPTASTAPGPAAEDPADHYVPPPPPPLPQADPVTRLAWMGVVGGPLFFLLTALLQTQVPALLAFLGIAAFVAGFVTLVARMPDRPGPDDDPDDGAVV